MYKGNQFKGSRQLAESVLPPVYVLLLLPGDLVSNSLFHDGCDRQASKEGATAVVPCA
jgi:hypothetical protein